MVPPHCTAEACSPHTGTFHFPLPWNAGSRFHRDAVHGLCVVPPLISLAGPSQLARPSVVLRRRFAMRPSPSIVPSVDRDVCLVLDDFGRLGLAWCETGV